MGCRPYAESVHVPSVLVLILVLVSGCVSMSSPGVAPPASLPPSPSVSPSPSVVPSPTVAPSPSSPPPSASIEPTSTSVPSASPAPSESVIPSAEPTSEPRRGFAPARFQLRAERIADGLDAPVFLSGDGTGSGRLYIVERPGTIRIWEKGKVRAKPFLDIHSRVDTQGERGLHAVAFHPRYDRNGRLYVHYNDAAGRTHLVEFRVRDGASSVATSTARDILTLSQPEWNHNGGWIGFGPDGYLYVALGDGGGNSPGDPQRMGQRKSTLLAKVLRIDVDAKGRYGIPRDNPYAKGQRGFAKETWVWGLRNPWRASFDRETGDLWIGDVGQDRFEEVDFVPAGKSGFNFGWSDMEGEACHLKADCDPRDYRAPVAVYRHGPHCSISGGYVYRGSKYPALYGGYLFADFCSGVIWGLDADAIRAGEPARARELLDAQWNWVSFGEDDDGELYIISLGGGIYRLRAQARG